MSRSDPSELQPETLFHYTDAAGLVGILNGSQLWASDVRFLNDASEVTYASDLFVAAAKATPTSVISQLVDQYGPHGLETFQDFQRFVVDELNSEDFGIHVACFCESGDLLSQWRAYGTDHGYAIEMKAAALRESVSDLMTYPPATGLVQVRYGRDHADEVVREIRAILEDFNLNHPGVKAHYTALELTAKMATMKHPGFTEEKEWRLFAGFERSYVREDSPVPLRFRPTKMAIVPYIELPLPSDAITSIRIGPGSSVDVREVGVRLLLKSIGHDAEILRSDLPLRV